MKLDFTPLEKALLSMERAISRSQSAPKDEELRDAVIQRFEYTMDLSWKFIRRVVRAAGVRDEEIRTKRDLFREGAKLGLIKDPAKWFAYHEARNETSHTYNLVVAQRVYEKALEFFKDAKILPEALRKHDDA